MSLQNTYGLYIKRSVQLLLLIAVGWFLPEIIFYFIDFGQRDKLEIKSYIVALFAGIFILDLVAQQKKRGKDVLN